VDDDDDDKNANIDPIADDGLLRFGCKSFSVPLNTRLQFYVNAVAECRFTLSI
jgi:hypothetical protein